MIEKHADLASEIRKALSEHFSHHWRQVIDKELQQFDDLQAMVNEMHGEAKPKDAEPLISLLSTLWTAPDPDAIQLGWSSLHRVITQALESTEFWQVQEQSKDRFIHVDGDSFFLRVLKPIKYLGFVVSTLPARVANLFRKTRRPIAFWLHHIPERNLATYHFHHVLVHDLLTVFDSAYRSLSQSFLALKHWEDSFYPKADFAGSREDVDKARAQLAQRFDQQIQSELVQLVDARYAAFRKDFERVGTWELRKRKFSTRRLARSESRAHEAWNERHERWHHTMIALFDEWRLDADLRHLIYQCHQAYEEFEGAQTRKLREQVDPKAEEIGTFIGEAVKDIQKHKDELGKTLKSINFQVDKKLITNLVPALLEKISGQHTTGLINRLELTIAKEVEELTSERIIVKTNSYDEPMGIDELKRVSPYELISFESLNAFKRRAEQIRHTHFSAVDTVSRETADIGYIVSYSCESAIEALEDPSKTEEEVQTIALEGIGRAQQRLEEAKSQFKEVMERNSADLKEAIDEFTGDVLELTINENVSELRLRITKARAAKQAQAFRDTLRDKLRGIWRSFWQVAKEKYSATRSGVQRLSQRFILTASKPAASREISDFLIESRHAIEQLPPIYRRLYKIEPLEELELFEGRAGELQIIQKAYSNWREGRNAATAIVGEKWGGLTSFINYIVHQEQFPHIICRYVPTSNYYRKSELVKALATALKNEELEDTQAIIDYLNTGLKRVVIIEDLQNLYLRRIGGFEAMEAVFQIITRTSMNVFWLTSSTLYAWNYLTKAIHIQEYFSYVVELKPLTSEQIVNIIWKRNRISGFKIHFEAEPTQLRDKKFRRLSETDQQAVLKNSFFRELNDFAKSNVSLALIFWLLSTKKVDERTITIGTFHRPDLNFISVLSMDKVHVLHALILHDGLADEQLSDVLNTSLQLAQLNVLALLEDGILIKTGNSLLVNPIVYRNTINMLKSRNFIH